MENNTSQNTNEVIMAEEELLILIHHLIKMKKESVVIKYHPRDQINEEILEINLDSHKYSWRLSKDWDKMASDFKNAFPTRENLERLDEKLSSSTVKNFTSIKDRVLTPPTKTIAVDTNILHNLLFTRKILIPYNNEYREILRYSKIFVPSLVVEEIQKKVNEENRKTNLKINRKHKLGLSSKLSLTSRIWRVTLAEYMRIKPFSITEKKSDNYIGDEPDLKIVKEIDNFQTKYRNKVVLISADKLMIEAIAEVNDIDSVFLKFESPKNHIIDTLSMAQLIYLTTVYLSKIKINGICECDIKELKNDIVKYWANRSVIVKFFDQNLAKVVMRDLEITRKMSKI